MASAKPTSPGRGTAEQDPVRLPDPMAMGKAWAEIAERSQKLVAEFLERQRTDGPAELDPLNLGQAFIEMTTRLIADPSKLAQAQMQFWGEYMTLWQRSAMKFMGHDTDPVARPESGDRRFKDAAWDENVVFDFIKQSYLLASKYIQGTVKEVDGLDGKTSRKVDFYTRQFVDAMAPSNFVMTNPQVLRTTLETGGENLVKGLDNLLTDLERGHGELRITMTDTDAFEVGRNIAVSPGQVVFQNDLMQLIQYAPSTETVARRPLLIIPPWINKFYILDLRPENSFIRWAVSQGLTVFVISWVNPDARLAQKSFEDYMFEGPLAAMEAIERQTGETDLNVIGYCLGGTLLAATLAHMTAKGTAGRVKSATYFTTMIDFQEAGELGVFIDEEQLAALEARMAKEGYLDGSAMATTFNMLRANDLIWSFVVNNYLLGKEPFPFDLLYWNSDSTRMPAAMHSYYLRRMYQENKLVEPGALSLGGTPIDLSRIEVPSFILSTKEDHIAPWRSTYAGTQIYGGPVKFVLSGSGHIAGVVNPPEPVKYAHWTNSRRARSPEAWLKGAAEKPGSWWPEWRNWVKKFDGGSVPARDPGKGPLPPIEPAPGAYVKVRAVD